ncbi:MAG TPA: TrkA family potassium uptake protein [Candidatus Thermoplasmatota archaeon]|nr:TrkA family potassium uptake protein [Candidatus Thermoplasmatota archaeon]
MFFVIVGAGSTGLRLAELALKDKHEVVLIDKDRARCEEVAQKFDVVAIHGDATHETTLRDAEAARADGLVTTAKEDAVNLMVASIAQKIGVPVVATTVQTKDIGIMFKDRGVLVVENPSEMASRRLYQAILRPNLRDLMPVGRGFSVVRVELEMLSEYAGRTVQEADFPDTTYIVSIERDGKVVLPEAATVLEGADVVTLLTEDHRIDRLVKAFQGK